MLQTLGEQPERYEAQTLRAFILNRVGDKGIGRAKTVVTAVRMFLRFLVAIGRCPPGLEQALPSIAHWRLSYLPRYLPAESVEQVLASCDLTTAIGVRDRDVLLLLAQLGLRAGDVATLKWCEIDWHEGTLCVMGKNRRQTRLPLPQEVGEAILDYAEHGRPRAPSAYVFLTTVAPIRPISPKTVTKLPRTHSAAPTSTVRFMAPMCYGILPPRTCFDKGRPCRRLERSCAMRRWRPLPTTPKWILISSKRWSEPGRRCHHADASG